MAHSVTLHDTWHNTMFSIFCIFHLSSHVCLNKFRQFISHCIVRETRQKAVKQCKTMYKYAKRLDGQKHCSLLVLWHASVLPFVLLGHSSTVLWFMLQVNGSKFRQMNLRNSLTSLHHTYEVTCDIVWHSMKWYEPKFNHKIVEWTLSRFCSGLEHCEMKRELQLWNADWSLWNDTFTHSFICIIHESLRNVWNILKWEQ